MLPSSLELANTDQIGWKITRVTGALCPVRENRSGGRGIHSPGCLLSLHQEHIKKCLKVTLWELHGLFLFQFRLILIPDHSLFFVIGGLMSISSPKYQARLISHFHPVNQIKKK